MNGAKVQNRGIDHYFASEHNFCQLFSEPVSELNEMHWAPLKIIQMAARFLAYKPGVRILDIGSGPGKFCLAAAYYQPEALFFGVEQRQNLVDEGRMANETLGGLPVDLICKNFTQLNFGEYDAFFFYNSFFENLPGAEKIDESLSYSKELYDYYSYYLNRKFSVMPAGTRIVTYCSWEDEIPSGYRAEESHMDGLLKFWIREKSLQNP